MNRLTFLVTRNGSKERCFTWRSSTSFTTTLLASPIHVIQFNEAFKDKLIIGILHHVLQLLFHFKSCIDWYAQEPAQTEGGHSLFCLRYEIDCQKPRWKRQFWWVKNGAAGDGTLMPASSTLEKLTGFQLIIVSVATFWALKITRPAILEELFPAFFFWAVCF